MANKAPIIIANCSGFYGDKLSAARQMVEGGAIDVLTGDYLAELTMAILQEQKTKAPEKGYVGTFVKQMQDVMALCLQRNIKIVSNAGGLNPRGLAAQLSAVAKDLGIEPKIAYIEGDNIISEIANLQNNGEAFINLDTGQSLAESSYSVLTANVYLGCWGIKEALDYGADIVICPRVTDAALTMGPAAWHFNWQVQDYDALAGALCAGHIIECGTHVSGGNFAFFKQVKEFKNIGYPFVEINQDGSFIVSKHRGTGGLISCDTVTAQLLYEIDSPTYLSPDVSAHFNTLKLEQIDKNKVRVSNCRGSKPPDTHKVCINTLAGYHNSLNLIIPGLDIEEKAKLFEQTLFDSIGGKDQFDLVDLQLLRMDKPNPQRIEESFAILQIHVACADYKKVSRIFSAKIIELMLASYPGFNILSPPQDAQRYLVHWPTLIPNKYISQTVQMEDFSSEIKPIDHGPINTNSSQSQTKDKTPEFEPKIIPASDTQRTPLGRLYGARSGDKGGNANLGVWATNALSYTYLLEFLTVDRLKLLLPDTAELEISRYQLPNIFAINFYIKGYLGTGVSSNIKLDGQAKALGEYLRVQTIEAPQVIITENAQ